MDTNSGHENPETNLGQLFDPEDYLFFYEEGLGGQQAELSPGDTAHSGPLGHRIVVRTVLLLRAQCSSLPSTESTSPQTKGPRATSATRGTIGHLQQ